MVAEIDDTVVTKADLEYQLSKQPGYVGHGGQTREATSRLLESLVRFQVLVHEAKKRGYDRDPEVVRAANQAMVDKLIQQVASARSQVSAGEAEEYYAHHSDEFNVPERVRVRMILLKERAVALRTAAMAKALDKSDDAGFRELVARFSEDPSSRSRSGDVGLFARKSTLLPPRVIEAAFSTEMNEVSGPIDANGGYFIIKTIQRVPAVLRTFERAKQEITLRLASVHRAQDFDAWYNHARTTHRIRIYIDAAEGLGQ